MNTQTATKEFDKKKREERNEYGLFTALHKFQSLGLLSDANGRNLRFKSDENPEGSHYSLLEDTIACANKGNEFGLFFTNHIITKEGVQYLKTVLRHINDTDILESDYPLKCSNETSPQSFGTVLTYAKRYNLHTLYGFGSVISEDDDGNSASPDTSTSNQQTNKF